MSKEMSTLTINGNTYEMVDKKAREDINALPSWSKQSEKPTYSADEIGAEESGTAENIVNEHNTSAESHTDIRLLIEGLTNRLNTLANSTDTDLDQIAELVEYIKSNRTLIESVTTNKVNVTDIINNLTTNVADKPLSAAQGVELLKLINLCNQAISNIKVPTKTSELENDKKYITYDGEEGVPGLSGYIHNLNIDIDSARFQADYAVNNMPRKTSQLQNDSGYITEDHAHDWKDLDNKPFSETQYHIIWDGNTENCETIGSDASILYKVSDKIIRGDEFTNSGLTVTYETGFTVGIPSSIGVIESNGMWNAGLYGIACVFDSELSGHPTGIYFTPYNFSENGKPIRLGPFTEGYVLNPESLPTHSHTPAEVGAEKSGIAEEKVTEHNASNESHNDIRLLIEGLTTRLNTIANSTDTDLDQLSELVEYIKSNRSLIDGITTGKVSVVDIINNLTTNVADKPLSAAQGVALKALIDAIVVPTTLSQLTGDATHRLVTDTEKQTWNNKSNFSGIFGDLSNKPTTLAGYGITDGITINEVIAKINEAISDVAGGLKFEIVDEVPVWGEGNTIYLVRSEDTDDNQYYNEYIFIESRGTWEKLGDTRINLAPYYTQLQVDNLIYNVQKLIPTRTSQLNNDSGFVRASELETGEATWNSIKGNILERVGTPVTWDGNTEGREVYEMKGSITGTFYKVSDIVVKAEDIVGCTYYTQVGGDVEKIVPERGTGVFFGLYDNDYSWILIAAGMVCLYDDSQGCSPGLYFNIGPYEYDNSKTEFVTKLIVEYDKIKPELLPDNMSVDMSKYFETVGTNTLTWDANIGDRLHVDLTPIVGGGLPEGAAVAVKISDSVPTIDQLNMGMSLTVVQEFSEDSANVTELVCDAFQEFEGFAGVYNNGEMKPADGDDSYSLSNPVVSVITNDVTLPNGVVMEKGTYFVRMDMGAAMGQGLVGLYMYASSVTFNGYNEFVKKEVLKNEHLNILETVDTDTLTWNGEFTDVSVDGVSYTYHRVSDITPRREDFVDAFTFSFVLNGSPFGSETITSEDFGSYFVEWDNILDIGSNIVISYADNVDYNGVIFPKAGTYFCYLIEEGQCMYCSGLNIKGYTGFKGKEFIKNEYLSILETTGGSGTLTWDGNEEGKEIVDVSPAADSPAGTLFAVKMSNKVPTAIELGFGGTIKAYGEQGEGEDLIVENTEFTITAFRQLMEGVLISMCESDDGATTDYPLIFVIDRDLVVDNEGTVLTRGTYFLKADMSAIFESHAIMRTVSVTLNGYNGFNTKEVLKNEHLNIFETIGADTLFWDGKIGGRVSASGMAYHVSDVIPTGDDLNSGGMTIELSVGDKVVGKQKTSLVFDAKVFGDELADGCYFVVGAVTVNGSNNIVPLVFIATKPLAFMNWPKNDDEVISLLFTKPGIYFGCDTTGLFGLPGVYVSRFSIDGYDGFKREAVKREYMPPIEGTLRTKSFMKPITAWEWLNKNYDTKKIVRVDVTNHGGESNYGTYEKITKETGDGSDGYIDPYYNKPYTGLSTNYYALHSMKSSNVTANGTSINFLRGGLYQSGFFPREGSFNIGTEGVSWVYDANALLNKLYINNVGAEDSGFEILLYYIEE